MKLNIVTALAGSAMLAIAAPALADPIITVTPTLAPNIYGSPSFDAWRINSLEALHQGVSSFGAAGVPTHYQAQNVATTAQAVVTGFPSWLGQADPGTVFGAAFASELGNRITFGVRIDGNGSQFSIDQMGFYMASTDPDLSFNAVAYAAGAYGYDNRFVGLLKGTDNMLFTSDDVWITGGPASQLVDGLIGVGSGASFAAYCPGCTTAQQQAAIDDVALYPGSSFQVHGAYTLGKLEGLGTMTLNPVPEPATWAMMIGGFALAGAAMRRRKAIVAFA